jgi:hypothetical protein
LDRAIPLMEVELVSLLLMALGLVMVMVMA